MGLRVEQSDRIKGSYTSGQTLPEPFRSYSERADRAEACDDDPLHSGALFLFCELLLHKLNE